MKLSKQFERELDEVRVPELFLAYYSKSHVQSRHVGVTVSDLWNRLKNVPYHEGICFFSRFYGDMKEACNLIADCIDSNRNEIEKWSGNRALELTCECKSVIGDGVVKGTKWHSLYDASNVFVCLVPGNAGRTFYVSTAYPVFNIDEVDVAYDAIDAHSADLAARAHSEKAKSPARVGVLKYQK